MSDARPIGVFDSGVGGLTVLRAIHDRLPLESTIYVGDLALFPYGPKPAPIVEERAAAILMHLLTQDVKAVVVACNTATAVALPLLEEASPVPVIGVVAPGAKAALDRSPARRVGVLATEGTVRSGAYRAEILRRCPSAIVHQRAAGTLVEAVESGLAGTVEMERLVWPLLSELVALGCDTVILGCTHFPIIRDVFEHLAGPEVSIVDSAETTAASLKDCLDVIGVSRGHFPEHQFLVTAEAGAFARQAVMLFGDHVRPERLDLVGTDDAAPSYRWRAAGDE